MRGLTEKCTFSYHVHHIVIIVHPLLYVLTDADSIMDETVALSLFWEEGSCLRRLSEIRETWTQQTGSRSCC